MSLQKLIKDIGADDGRFWEVFDQNNISQGVFMYGNMIQSFCPSGWGVIASAYDTLKSKNWTWKIIGNLYPLEQDSDHPIIQAKKVKVRKNERKKYRKCAIKRGFTLNDVINFGKYKRIKTFQWIIDNDKSYWNWLMANIKIMLHPEVNEYLLKQNNHEN